MVTRYQRQLDRIEGLLARAAKRLQRPQLWEIREIPRCGALSRSTGKPCRQPALANGRCRFHGGLSTGPRTPAGRARALANLVQYRKRAAVTDQSDP